MGERLAVLRREVRRPATDESSATQLVEQVSHGEPLADNCFRKQFSAWIERLGMLGHDLSGQRHVGRDDQITRLYQFDRQSRLVTSVGCGVPMDRLPNRV